MTSDQVDPQRIPMMSAESEDEPDQQRTVKINIQRSAYTSQSFDKAYHHQEKPTIPFRQRARNYFASKCACSGACAVQTLLGFLPFIALLRRYKWKQWILADLVAGLSVGVIHIPQGLGFAILTSVPAIYGLYASLFPVVIYFFFGTSNQVSVGTMALISIMIGTVVQREVEGLGLVQPPSLNLTDVNNSTTAVMETALDDQVASAQVGFAMSVTLLMGVFQILMSIFRLDIITNYMPMSFVSGFMTGAAFHIVTSQIPFLIGLRLPRRISGVFKVPRTYVEIFTYIARLNWADLIIGVICIAVLVVLKEIINEKYKKHLKVPIPAELIVVVLATIISHFCNLEGNYNVRTIGYIKRGIPAPEIPPFVNVQNYVVDSIVIAIIGFVVSISMAKFFTRKYKYQLDTNQELLAYGLSNAVGAFFHSFGGAVAPPRSLVHDSTGGKTQVASLFSCVLVLLVCVALGPLFQSLPTSTLAAIIIVALFPLFKQFRDIKTFWNVNRYDLAIWLVTWLSVLILDLTIGLGVGIGFSMLTVILQSQRVKGTLLGSADDTDIYAPVEQYELLNKDRTTKIFRFDSALYFANVDRFKRELFRCTVSPLAIKIKQESDAIRQSQNGSPNGVTLSPNETKSLETELTEIKEKSVPDGTEGTISRIILDCSSISYVDFMGANTLKQLHADYAGVDIRLSLACCTTTVTSRLKAIGLIGSSIGVYPTVHDAVNAC